MDPYTNNKMLTYINSTTLNKHICVYSYNSRGYSLDKQQFCRNLLNGNNDEISILCNQENFVLKSNEYLIQKSLPGFEIKFKPAVKSNLEGRPINGMFIAFPEIFKSNIKDISPDNFRVQAIILDTNTKKVMIINTYFPQDPKTVRYHHDPELEEVFALIEHIIGTNQCDDILLLGDMNIDFHRNNGHAKRLDSFLTSNILEASWRRFDVDYTHEVEIDDKTHTCTIDHIIWNENFFKNVEHSGVLHLPGNTSDHSPIFCSTNVMFNNESPHVKPKRIDAFNLTKLNSSDWEKYVINLEKKLQEVRTPHCADCRNVHCKDVDHIAEIDEYSIDILEAVDLCIKSIANRKKKVGVKSKVVPGWNNDVKPFQEEALFWHAIWISAGKPLNNTLHNIMKRTRNIYHYQIRKCKRSVDIIRKNKLLDACINSNGDIFSELRKLRQVKTSIPETMDGRKNVPEIFMQVCQEL